MVAESKWVCGGGEVWRVELVGGCDIAVGYTGGACASGRAILDERLAVVGNGHRRVCLIGGVFGGAVCAMVSVCGVLSVVSVAREELAFAYAIWMEHRRVRSN